MTHHKPTKTSAYSTMVPVRTPPAVCRLAPLFLRLEPGGRMA